MAEKEVCADVVKSHQESSGRVEGESLLLPLLQGLLDAPDNEQTADSGTESGEDLRNGLLNEVQNVLAKLANSLRNSHDMSEERRSSLLQLVTRLQTGLSSQQVHANERRSSGHGRFLKKRRHNRHTVGVSSEELEDARRLVEEMGLCRNKPTLEKSTEGHLSIPNSNLSQNMPGVKNVTAKPYGSPGSTSQSPSATSSTVNTPTEVTGVLQLSNPLKLGEQQASHFVSSNFLPEIQKKTMPHESETDEDLIAAVQSKPRDNETSIKLQSNPIYAEPHYQDEQKLNNKFNSRKLKIKRANTIDIPKAVNIYESEDDYDSDTSLVDKQSSRRNNYLALRGPIRVGRNHIANENMPIFEPKTESDKKFMAFINKHAEKNDHSSVWASQCQDIAKRGNNWNNRFGNIRTAFEKASVNASVTPTIGMNSARNFWMTADNAAAYRNEPKLNRHLQRRSEHFQEDKQRRMPWATINENEVVTGSLKVETKGLDVNKNYKFIPQPMPVNKFSHAPTSAFAAIPKKINPEVSTANQLVKTDYQNVNTDLNTPLFLYSPKPLANIKTPSPPSSSVPWANSNGVQRLAATKFEKKPSSEDSDYSIRKPKKVNKDFVFSGESETPLERSAAPYINRCIDTSSSVRKISDQFNKNPAPTNNRPNRTTPKTHSYSSNQFNNEYVPYPSRYEQNNYQVYKSTPTSNYEDKSFQVYSQQYQKQPYRDREVPEGYTSETVVKFTPAPTYNPPPPVLASVQYNRQVSQESVKEYEAAVTKVMKGPVAQQAVTVAQNSPKGRDQHDMEVAFNLKNALQKFADKSPERKLSIDSAILQPKSSTERKTQSFKKVPQTKRHNFLVNGKSLSMESTEINENGESVVTSKFHIPVTIPSSTTKSPSQQTFSKADVWNQLMFDQQRNERKPLSAPSSKSVLRSKSSHSLAVPTVQFQAGMTKDEVVQKKRSVEAYFSGSVSPQSPTRTPSDDSLDKSERVEVKVSKSSINRKRTSEKVSAHKQMSGGVSRSQTLPNIACPDLLDESKVEESFEDLFRSNA